MKLNGKQLLDLVSCALTLSQRNASLYKWEGINANSHLSCLSQTYPFQRT